MLTKIQIKKIKSLFAPHHAKAISELLEAKGVVNSINTPYSSDSITKTLNGRENLELEREILIIAVERKEQLKEEKKSLKL